MYGVVQMRYLGIKGELSTTANELSIDVEWSIPYFCLLTDKGFYCSPVFCFKGENWNLVIYPNGRNKHESSQYLGLCLLRECFGPSHKFEISLSLKTVNGEKYQERLAAKVFRIKDWQLKFFHFLRRSELLKRRSELLSFEVLTVLCTLKKTTSDESAKKHSNAECSFCKRNFQFCKPFVTRKEVHRETDKVPTMLRSNCIEDWYGHGFQPVEAKGKHKNANCSFCKKTFHPVSLLSHEKKCIERPIKCPQCSEVILLQDWNGHECQSVEAEGETFANLHRDFKELFIKQEDTDVVIKVKGHDFRTHRLILKSRSPVFASTFRHNMKENVTGALEIEDCDPASFSDFLCFLYCGDSQIISHENSFGLFFAADKYEVLDLRAKCLEFIAKNLSVEIFCETITLAMRYTETKLIELSTDFFIKNAEEILETVKWQTFVTENPTQGNELFLKYVKSVKQSNA